MPCPITCHSFYAVFKYLHLMTGPWTCLQTMRCSAILQGVALKDPQLFFITICSSNRHDTMLLHDNILHSLSSHSETISHHYHQTMCHLAYPFCHTSSPLHAAICQGSLQNDHLPFGHFPHLAMLQHWFLMPKPVSVPQAKRSSCTSSLANEGGWFYRNTFSALW